MGIPPLDQQVTFLYTRDLQETARFWEETIGLPLVIDQGSCRIYRVGGEAFIGFCRREQGPQPEGVIITLVTDQVDAWHEHLRAAGAPIEKSPVHNPDYNIYHLFARDPNGYLIEVQTFLDPAWPRPQARQT